MDDDVGCEDGAATVMLVVRASVVDAGGDMVAEMELVLALGKASLLIALVVDEAEGATGMTSNDKGTDVLEYAPASQVG